MKTRMIRIKKSGRTARLWTYFAGQCHLAKNLQNTANFYIRNLRTVILREESYTSKASLVDRDPIQEYKKGDSQEYHFSGKRIKRGLYRTKDGLLVNADLNGAGNVIRKEYPYAFDRIADWTYLSKTVDVITRAELCRAKKKSAGARPKRHLSYNRWSHHETHWDRKLGYMELFSDEKKKQPVKAA